MPSSAVLTLLVLCVAAHGALAQVSGRELSSIDYAQMIGGPLNAVIAAQTAAAQMSVNYINSVGFDKNGTAIMVDFAYNHTNATTGVRQATTISIPFIAMVPVPFLRIDKCTISFNAQIHSVTTTSASASSGVNVGVSGSIPASGPVSVTFSSTFSAQSSQSYSNTEERSFGMSINVTAVQDSMPSGMAKLLDVLGEAIMLDAY